MIARETRLLAGVAVVSVATLFLLARFRFPAEERAINPSPAPLERLAARATFDDLASIVTQLQSRVSPALAVLRVVGPVPPLLPRPALRAGPANGEATRSRLALAVRVRDDVAVAQLAPGDRVEAVIGEEEHVPVLVGVDPVRLIGLVRLGPAPPVDAAIVGAGAREGTAPRYVGVAEATLGGPVLRPIFLGRTDPIADPRWDRPLLALGGAGVTPPGSLIFSLDGRLEGLTVLEESLPVVVPTEALLQAVDELQHGRVGGGGDAGIEIGDLTPTLLAATGAEHGAVVTYVKSTGSSAGALRIGDVVETVNGDAVYSADLLRVLIARTSPGVRLDLGIVRDRQRITATVVTAASAGGAQGEAPVRAGLGLVLRSAPGAGAEVLRVLADSAGREAGFQPGDLIVALNGVAMPAPAAIHTAFDAARSGDYLVAGVARGDTHLVLALRKP